MKNYNLFVLLLFSFSLLAMNDPEIEPLLDESIAPKVQPLINKQQELRNISICEFTPMETIINYKREFPLSSKKHAGWKKGVLGITYCLTPSASVTFFLTAAACQVGVPHLLSALCCPCIVSACVCATCAADEVCSCCIRNISYQLNSKENRPAKVIAVSSSTLEMLLAVYKKITPSNQQDFRLIKSLSKKEWDDLFSHDQEIYLNKLPAEILVHIAKFTLSNDMDETRRVSSYDVFSLVQQLYNRSTKRRTYYNGLRLKKDKLVMLIEDRPLEAWLYHVKPEGSKVNLPGTPFCKKYCDC